MLDQIQTYFTKTVSELNFFHKPYLFDELKSYLKKENRKKVLVIMGNSRALLFNNKYIDERYPDWILFNFSVPGGGPDYFLFWLEKFKKENIKPDFILIDSAIEFFNQTPLIKLDESLVNGLEVNFVLRYANRYSRSEISGFLAKRLFKTYQYRPKLNTILERMKNNSQIQKAYLKWRSEVSERLILERGSASSEFYKNSTQTESVIQKYAEGDANSYLTPFQFNQDILSFQRDNLLILKELGVPGALIMVRVAPAFFNNYKTKLTAKDPDGKLIAPYDIYIPHMHSLQEEFGVPFLNMNEDTNYSCNAFTDASHMSSECFPDYTDYIFQNINKILSKEK